jgi:anti-sigma regulatory factor (Ser/Thr protein kinase)
MVAIQLLNFEDVRKAREWVDDLAQAAGIDDPAAAVLTTGELGNNCVEHGAAAPGLLWIGCQRGRLILQFENRCAAPPDWRTLKPEAVGEFRTGGYGLQIARALARSVNCRWVDGRVIVSAEFE